MIVRTKAGEQAARVQMEKKVKKAKEEEKPAEGVAAAAAPGSEKK